MKAVVCRSGELSVREIPIPRPGPGQILLNVARAGICGSDLHLRVHADHLADMMAAVGYHDAPRHDQEVVFGHEICGEVAEYGSVHATGAYAEQIIVQESISRPSPPS